MSRSERNLISMKIVTKIILTFLIILLLTMITFGFFIYKINNIKNILNSLYSTFIVTNNFLSAEKDIHNINSNLKNIFSALEQNKGKEAYSLIPGLVTIDISIKNNLKDIKEWIKDDIEKKILVKIDELFKEWENVESELIKNVKEENYTVALSTVKVAQDNFEKVISMFRIINGRTKVIADNSYKDTQELIKKVTSGRAGDLFLLAPQRGES